MNNDNFTKAAHAEAEKRHQGDWDPFEQEPVDDWGFAEAERRAFVAGAEWARAHLAAQEPDDAEVEAAARALWAMRWSTPWDEYSAGRGPASRDGNDLRAVQVRRARAALSAARNARRDEEDRP